ncbi:hypothetical protein QQY66_20490 [Streptomyces sp. DG2A-72]|uniref:hypothetical protein n=1 Tax=Streptomyces sp. DG2A-72 TaxID=3051386 RepID=UPI00265BE79E|nr:hypothetical protein [Streptomyces sp. DG2A-72]MDO0933946.1 hypothetical protein [Streptomyces sp. DG2A-72]
MTDGTGTTPRVVAVNRRTEQAPDSPPAGPGPRHRALDAWVGRWINQGDSVRSTVVFSDDHGVQTVLHERTDDGTTYRPSIRSARTVP